jgi:hypothetical protein
MLFFNPEIEQRLCEWDNRHRRVCSCVRGQEDGTTDTTDQVFATSGTTSWNLA